jgi:hypothetical protein
MWKAIDFSNNTSDYLLFSGRGTAQTRAKLSSMKTLQEEREFCNGFVKGKKGFSKRQVRKLAEGGQDRLVQQHPL